MINLILDAFLVCIGVGAAIYFWHDNQHWAVGLFIVAFGILIAMISLSASLLVSLAFSESGWQPFAREKTFATVVIGVTMAVTGMLLLLAHAIHMLWWRMRRSDTD